MDHRTEVFLRYATGLGDSGLLVVISVVVAIYLSAMRQQRAAVILLVSVALCLVTMGLLKVVFIGCGHFLPSLEIRSPSGHAAMAMTVYGTLANIIARFYRGWRVTLAKVLALYLIAVIAVSRFLLEYHSIMEVVAGLVVGVVLVGFSAFLLRGTQAGGDLRLRYFVGLILVAMLALYGTHVPGEVFIDKIAHWAQARFHYCT